jgi:putative membrane protein
VTYHFTVPPAKFGGDGAIRVIYFFILITHIILAASIVPLALISIYRSFTAQYEKHKKIARITFPLWLYVAVTGVVVYLMMAPYYPA